MTKYTQSGFLSDESNEWAKEIREKNRRLFEFAEKVNKAVQPTVLSEFDPHQRDARELISKLFLIRSVSKFQAIVFLAERGMFHEGRIILRSLLETMFYVVAMAKDRETYKKVAAKVFFEQKKTSNIFQRWIDDGVIVETEELATLISSLREMACENIEEHELTEKKIFEVADLGDNLLIYNTTYRRLCSDTHASILALAENLEIGSDGEIHSIISGPSVEGLDLLLLTAVSTLLSTYDATRKIFGLTGPDLASEFTETLEELSTSID